MKLVLSTIMLAGVLTVFGGCQLVNAPTWYTASWRGFRYQEAKRELNSFRNVMLVCVTEDYGEQGEEEFGGRIQAGPYLQHFKATVARSYRGDSKPGDRVAFVIGHCPCDGKRELKTNVFAGDLKFVLAEGRVRTDAEFVVRFMDLEPYDQETERLFTHLFRSYNIQPRGSQHPSSLAPGR